MIMYGKVISRACQLYFALCKIISRTDKAVWHFPLEEAVLDYHEHQTWTIPAWISALGVLLFSIRECSVDLVYEEEDEDKDEEDK